VSESAAVAVNCAALPTAGAVPATVTAATFPEPGGGVPGVAVGDVVDAEDDDGVDDGAAGELVHAELTARAAATSRRDVRDIIRPEKPRAYPNG
jgi:hypothetical protein